MVRGQGIGPYRGASLDHAAQVRSLLTQHQCLATDSATGELIPVGQGPAFFLDDVSPWPVFNALVLVWIPRWLASLEAFHCQQVGQALTASLYLASMASTSTMGCSARTEPIRSGTSSPSWISLRRISPLLMVTRK